MSVTIELPSYSGKSSAEVVHALKIEELFENPRGVELHFEDKRYCPMQFPSPWIETHGVKAGGYFVWDRYGDKSFVSCGEFEDRFKLQVAGT